jgi:hypothetical protein
VRELKEELDVNVEQVCPAEFIPLPEGAESRAIHVGRYGALKVYHFDPYPTALSKIERGTDEDFDDVRAMLRAGLIEWPKMGECFEQVMRTYGTKSLPQDSRRSHAHFGALPGEFDPPAR